MIDPNALRILGDETHCQHVRTVTVSITSPYDPVVIWLHNHAAWVFGWWGLAIFASLYALVCLASFMWRDR